MLSDEVVDDDGSGEVAYIMGLGDGEISVPAKGIPVKIESFICKIRSNKCSRNRVNRIFCLVSI